MKFPPYPIRTIPDVLLELPPEQWKKRHWDLRLGHFVATVPERIALMFDYLKVVESGDVEKDLLNIGEASTPCFRNAQFFDINPNKGTFVFGQSTYQLGPDRTLTEQGVSLAMDIGLVMAKHLQALAPEKIDWVMDKGNRSVTFAFPFLRVKKKTSHFSFPASQVSSVIAAQIGNIQYGGEGWLQTYRTWEEIFLQEGFLD